MQALIIEDDGLIALHLEALLRSFGFDTCVWATTEDDAIDAARERCPDLVTADLHLRAGDGMSAVQRICARRPVPVVYVTGDPDELDGVPPALVVAKPFTDVTLEPAIAAARAGLRWRSGEPPRACHKRIGSTGG